MFRVKIIESERGWGAKIDEIKEFPTKQEAEAFVKEYNRPNDENWERTHEVPEWYMQASLMD